jgi:hypothetical protein
MSLLVFKYPSFSPVLTIPESSEALFPSNFAISASYVSEKPSVCIFQRGRTRDESLNDKVASLQPRVCTTGTSHVSRASSICIYTTHIIHHMLRCTHGNRRCLRCSFPSSRWIFSSTIRGLPSGCPSPNYPRRVPTRLPTQCCAGQAPHVSNRPQKIHYQDQGQQGYILLV